MFDAVVSAIIIISVLLGLYLVVLAARYKRWKSWLVVSAIFSLVIALIVFNTPEPTYTEDGMLILPELTLALAFVSVLGGFCIFAAAVSLLLDGGAAHSVKPDK